MNVLPLQLWKNSFCGFPFCFSQEAVCESAKTRKTEWNITQFFSCRKSMNVHLTMLTSRSLQLFHPVNGGLKSARCIVALFGVHTPELPGLNPPCWYCCVIFCLDFQTPLFELLLTAAARVQEATGSLCWVCGSERAVHCFPHHNGFFPSCCGKHTLKQHNLCTNTPAQADCTVITATRTALRRSQMCFLRADLWVLIENILKLQTVYVWSSN